MSDGDPAGRTRDLPTPARALAVGAHPDDVDFGCGGTLAKWSSAGCEVHVVVCTDGSKGSWDAGADTTALIAVRQEEQRAAARALGATGRVVFLGHTDGELESGLREREEITYWIRRLRPEVVLGHDPWKRYRLHPDHRNAGLILTDGIVAARDPHFFPGQSVAAHRPGALLLWEAEETDHVEDVTAHLDAKIDALMAHESQYRSTMDISATRPEAELEAFRSRIAGRAADEGREAGIAFAERFKIMTRL